MVTRPLLIYLIAGEPSGDAIGARLISAIRENYNGELEFAGIGGAAMEAVGFRSLFPIQELSVMGLVEVLPHIRNILHRISEISEDVADRRPDLIVTIDSPSFSTRVAKKIATLDIPKVHYVAPTVWAWRPWRVHKFKRYYDHLLAILPFEPPYFERVGLNCEFVGHPVLEYGADIADGSEFRTRYKLPDDMTVICLLPGSRRGEVTRHIGIFGETLQLLRDRGYRFKVVIPTLPQVSDLVREGIKGWQDAPIVIDNAKEKYPAMAASNASIAASGTVALELALARVPTVVGYRVNPITAFIVKCLIRVDFVNLLNLLAESEVVLECIQEKCTPNRLADELQDLLGAKGPDQIAKLQPLISQLGRGGEKPSVAAAKYLLQDVLNSKTD